MSAALPAVRADIASQYQAAFVGPLPRRYGINHASKPVRDKLHALREEFANLAGNYRGREADEWANLHIDVRECLLLMASIDNTADKAWLSYGQQERAAIKIAARGLHRALGHASALRSMI